MAADRTRALLEWYRRHGRDLPWRETSDPWAILVSEVMSQQTQISRVIPTWSAFMERFPTPADLAGADLSELITLWAGLGYQRRAVNLHRTARIVATSGWPSDVDGLEQLPGVGPYTAAAVACFAFGEAVPAVDTNLKRILSRWRGEPLAGVALREAAAVEFPPAHASDWTQALMDLGATVCRPKNPACDVCPVEDWCIDPGVYQPPPRQSAYEGSLRQARAAVLRTVARDGAMPVESLSERSGIDKGRVETAIASLVADGTVQRHDGLVSITG